jgi:hypothetical protein
VIATDAFSRLARDAAKSQGLSDARIIDVEHPIGGIDDDELRGRSQTAADELLRRIGRT